MNDKIMYGNSIIKYDVIHSRRLKISQIQIDHTGVHISIPYANTKDDAKNIIKARAHWIFRTQLHLKNQKYDLPIVTFVEGSKIPLHGKNYTIKIIQLDTEKIKLAGEFMEFYTKQKRPSKEHISQMYHIWIKKKAGKYFAGPLEKFSKMLNVKYDKINIKYQKILWGSTTRNNQINLNYNLAKVPQSAIDYIILHELCHLKIRNHSSVFWNLIFQHMPDYKKRIAWLKIHGSRINANE